MPNEKKNEPSLWRDYFPIPLPDGNKYDRGHAVVMGGGLSSAGAAKLAARAALRSGAGLVSVACDNESLPVYAASFQAVMTKLARNIQEFLKLISDKRVTAVLLGPACGVDEKTKGFTLAALTLGKSTLLDADAITVFNGNPQQLFSAIKFSGASCVLTPHEGEFANLFANLIDINNSRSARARAAAQLSGAVVVLKGVNTVIASPDGRLVVNYNATPYLATAGSGDVLAGICTGLLAQSMPAFEAACAAVWLHAEVGARFGAGLIAEDIEEMLPEIFSQILSETNFSKNPKNS